MSEFRHITWDMSNPTYEIKVIAYWKWCPSKTGKYIKVYQSPLNI